MKENEAIDIIYEGLIGDKSIPNDLRMNKKLDYHRLENIVSAINFLIIFYKEKSSIPKKLAYCFVDVYGLFQFKQDFFSEEILIEYENIGVKLQELGYQLFNVYE